MGREVNPEERYIDGGYLNQLWIDWNKAHPEYPVFSTTGKPVEEYSGEARLSMCERPNEDAKWQLCEIDGHDPICKTGWEQSECWIVSPPTASTPIEKVHSLLSGSRSVRAIPMSSTKGKVDTSIVYGPGNDNYGRDAPLLNQSASKEPLKVGEEKTEIDFEEVCFEYKYKRLDITDMPECNYIAHLNQGQIMQLRDFLNQLPL